MKRSQSDRFSERFAALVYEASVALESMDCECQERAEVCPGCRLDVAIAEALEPVEHAPMVQAMRVEPAQEFMEA